MIYGLLALAAVGVAEKPGSATTIYRIGVVGSISPEAARAMREGVADIPGVRLVAVPQPDIPTAEARVRAGSLAAAVIDGNDVVVRRDRSARVAVGVI